MKRMITQLSGGRPGIDCSQWPAMKTSTLTTIAEGAIEEIFPE